MNLELKFLNFKNIPDWITIAPLRVLNILYESGAKVNFGNLITPFQAKNFPCLIYWPIEVNKLYTLVIIDIDSSKITHIADSFLMFLACNIHANDILKGNYLRTLFMKYSKSYKFIFLLF